MRIRIGLRSRAKAAMRSAWHHAKTNLANLAPLRLGVRILSASGAWLLMYIAPALATGLVFAAALGRYTTETQFAQNAFQNYLRPYQTQYRQCLRKMDALRDRWENFEYLLGFSAENTDSTAIAPVVVLTQSGPISFGKDDTAETVLGRIVEASREASSCTEESIRQAQELAILLNQEEWFNVELGNRNRGLAEFQKSIDTNWSSISGLPKWEIVEATILRAQDSVIPSSNVRNQAGRYRIAVERFRAHLVQVHIRHRMWFEELDSLLRKELAVRSSRSVGFFLSNVVEDLLPGEAQPPTPAVRLWNASLVWTTPISESLCACSGPIAGESYQRMGEPP